MRQQRLSWFIPSLAVLAACSAEPVGPGGGGTMVTADGTMVAADGTMVAADGTVTAPDGTVTAPDGTVTAPDGTVTTTATGAGGAAATVTSSGGGATTTTGGTASGAGGATETAVALDCSSPNPGRAPLKRLTSFEYNNVVKTVLGDTTRPADAFPSELIGNGFGNDADAQPISSFLAEQYGVVAEEIAARAVGTTELLSARFPCAATIAADTEAACAQTIIAELVPQMYRRPLEAGEAEQLLTLQQDLRVNGTFEESIASLVEGLLQSPDFLYRFEWGVPDSVDPTLMRPSGAEMANRLSFLLWGDMPDETLRTAAAAGELATAAGVLTHASRLLDDQEKSWPMVEFFFDRYLPLNTLTDLARDAALFPTFSPTIGSLMRQETQTFLQNEIYAGPGDWASILTAPYTYVNETLANFYGIAGVTGNEFQRVDLDTTKRLGLLTQGGIMTGTTITNFTNPVRRGGFLVRDVMCLPVPDPPAELAVMPPDPYSGATGRDRYTAHSAQALCAGCHGTLDPPGFAFENYDAVGLWRDTENDVVIDASGEISGLDGPFAGPIDLVQKIAASPDTHSCFAEHWATYAYGRTLEDADACTLAALDESFASAGYNVKQLLLALTQTDAFLYLPGSN